MSERTETAQQSTKQNQQQNNNQRRQQQYYNHNNQYRNHRHHNHQHQQHSYSNEQNQRRYSNQRYTKDSLEKNKIKDTKDEEPHEEETTGKAVSKQLTTDKSYIQQISTVSAKSIDSFSHASKNCVCCLHNLSTYVTYSCMHYICLHCAIKLRILCEKLDCPICRQQSDNVICTKDSLTTEQDDEIKEPNLESTNKFLNLLKNYHKFETLKGGFNIEIDRIGYEYEELLSHRCKICKGGNIYFNTFEELDTHMKRQHQLFYCELCTQNLKLFTFERKFYNRQQLGQHRREGDVDDQSFKGHPNCGFCDERFFDRDELYRHYRKDHFYCHFCDADGHEEYYKDYVELRRHFKVQHYLCEIDECGYKESMGHDASVYSVFRTEIDYNAHKRLKHARTKSEAKNYGKLNIEFNISNPIRDRIRERNNRNNNQQQNENQQSSTASALTTSTQSLIIDDNSYGSTSSRSNDDSRGEMRKKEKQAAKQSSKLRDLYEKYEENQSSTTTITNISEVPVVTQAETRASTITTSTTSSLSTTTTSTSTVSSATVELPTASALPSTWRDLISSGPVPRMNVEAEFPTLSGEKGASSLASLGESIAKHNTNVWAKKANQSTKQTNEDSNVVIKEGKKGGKNKQSKASTTSATLTTSTTNTTTTTTTASSASHHPRTLSDNVPEIDSHMVDLRTYLNKTKAEKEQRNTSGETFQVINKKQEFDDENEETSNKKKDKKSKNKKKKEQQANENGELKLEETEKVKEEIKPTLASILTTTPTTNTKPTPPPPPPGFLKPVETSVNIEQQSQTSSLVATPINKNPPPGFNMPQASPLVFETKLLNSVYVKPPNYDQRNNDLTLELISLLDGPQFSQFKSISLDYHTEKLNAKSYLEKCKNILKNDSEKYKKFLDLLPEMIILLPDIRLQNQIYDEYLVILQEFEKTDQTAQQPKQQQQQPTKVKLAWADKQPKPQAAATTTTTTATNNAKLINCINCNQLLGNNEVNIHLSLAHKPSNINSSSSSSSKIINKTESNEEFPPLFDQPTLNSIGSNIIFNNPKESLSLVNKKKGRRKFLN